jgi:RNA polymerase sigma factor (sigma-70 family)
MYQESEHIPGEATMCMKTACDESLVEAAKGGKHSAYAELCRRHSSRTFRTVHRIIRNTEDAEDALQESLMKAFVHLGSFDGRSAFSSWLTRIAINSALMMLRKKRNTPTCSLEGSGDAEQSIMFEPTEPSINPEDKYLQLERKQKLGHAIGRLSPVLKGVVEIRLSQDASVEEIAESLGISTAATKSRLLRAKIQLRRPLERMQISRKPINSTR